MEKLKIYQRAPNKNADLLKKISLMGTKEHNKQIGWLIFTLSL